MTSKGMALPAHPYYPIGLEIAGYLANEWDTLTLLFIFAAGCTAIFSVTYLVVMKVHPRISPGDLWTVHWFVLCGFIHLFLEGYYVYNFRHMPGMQDLFGQLWKVYSLSDSRYQTQDAFVLSMEAITSICWGPLSFVLALTIMTQNNLRYPFQIVVSLGQLYGDVLYYATSLFDHYILGLSYSRPEGQIFWGLFVFLNAFWVFIPIHLLYTGVLACKRAFEGLAVSEAKDLGNIPHSSKSITSKNE